jgi:predicted membrane-bound mannosyltransferase
MCAVIHVLFYSLNHFLLGCGEAEIGMNIPEEIGSDTATTAKKLVQYFASQRINMNQVLIYYIFKIVFAVIYCSYLIFE